ncbi:rhamnogalacturonan acetylesterase [Lacticaseibacillus jixiensis]|uniref:rhamnogalacturonan acetylesterase n=1 Tax=Lacticaseibacillus jixiensis TaxID=3231926 RepID=UPI0036F223BF
MVTLFIAGDSTAAKKLTERRPETGWGECLQGFFDPARVTVDNRALNGRSSKSFIAQGHLKEIEQVIQPGDYMFIQFGHNDQKLSDPQRGTHAFGDYQDYMRQYIQVAKAHQATPILLTSVTRRKYLADGSTLDPQAVGDFPEATRQIAQAEGLVCLDMFVETQAFLSQFPPAETTKFFMNFASGVYSNYPAGSDDNTHSRPAGALLNAWLVAKALRNSPSPLRNALL